MKTHADPEASTIVSTTEKNTTPPAAKRKWLRRCALALLLTLLAGGAWLFWPVTIPAMPLLAHMPRDMAFGVELRRGAALWDTARTDGLGALLQVMPFWKTLVPLVKEHGADLDTLAGDITRQIDAVLNAPRGWGQGRRALLGDIAVATTDTRFRDAVLLAKVDNLTATLLRLAIRKNGTPADTPQMIPAHLTMKRGERTWHLAYVGGLLVGGTSPERLRDAAAWRKNDLSPILGRAAAATESILVWTRPNGEFHEAMRRRLRMQAWWLRETVCTMTRVGNEFRFDANSLLHERTMEALCRGATIATMPDLRHDEREKNARVWCGGFLAPRLSWHGFSRRLWDNKQHRPLRGESQPATVLLWDWLDKGIVKHTDGRFLMELLDPPAVKALRKYPYFTGDGGTPPAPELVARWGIQGDSARAAADFASGAEAFVNWYRRPGGSELYQTVRQETRLHHQPAKFGGKTVNYNGTIDLHPLFFNHMRPAWLFLPDQATFQWMGEPVPSPQRTRPLAIPVRDKPQAAETLADLVFGWDCTPQFADGVDAFLRDKLIRHAFLPEAHHPAAETGLALLKALLETVQEGDGDVFLFRDPRAGRDHPLFPMKATLRVKMGRKR